MVDPRPIARFTTPMLAVLAALLREERSYGLRIAEQAQIRTGTVYPILARFERAGWVASVWEDKAGSDERQDAGPRRRYYRLTADGREGAVRVFEARGVQPGARLTWTV